LDELKLQDALVFLAASALVLPLAKKFRASPIIGFLILGIVLGPYGLARMSEASWVSYVVIADLEGVRAFGELGVVFLLFMIGLELSVERLLALRRLVFGLGTSQILLSGLAIGFTAYWFGNSLDASIVLGACLALSSTAVVMQILSDQGRFGSATGQGTFAVLLAQDLAVVPILILVVTLGGRTTDSLAWSLFESIGLAVACVLLIFFVGRLVVRPLFRFAGGADSPAPFMALTLFTVISLALGSHAFGLSAALGAFLAGLLLSETEYRHEIAVSMEPFKGLLLGLFFISVGMRIDLVSVWQDPFWIAVSIFGLFALKAPLAAVLARAYGHNWAVSTEIGLLLGQGGEFAFVVVAMALTFGLLPEDTALFMISVVTGTVFLTPFVASGARLLAARIETHVEQDGELPLLAHHVIIVGYGRTGRLLADLLDRQQIPHVALDLDSKCVDEMRAQGAPVYFGDARRTGMLERMQIATAAAVVVCPDDPEVTESVTAAAQRIAPNVPTIARASDVPHAASLVKSGVSYVVPETLESGLQMGHALLEQIGLPQVAARDMVEAYRIEAVEIMQEGEASS
jgi:CPA2 family monovalent cation:H+ antiporter-2